MRLFPFLMLKIEKQSALTEANSVVIPRREAPPRFLRVGAAVAYCGLGRSLLYQHLNNGTIRSHRVGRVRLIDRESLDLFIQSHEA